MKMNLYLFDYTQIEKNIFPLKAQFRLEIKGFHFHFLFSQESLTTGHKYYIMAGVVSALQWLLALIEQVYQNNLNTILNKYGGD